MTSIRSFIKRRCKIRTTYKITNAVTWKINGSESWELLDPDDGHQCWAVHFVDESTGYYINNSGGSHLIEKTKDGGATWSPQILNIDVGLYAFYFIDPNTIVTVGSEGSIFRTTNGGETSAISNTESEQSINFYPNPATNELYIDNIIGSTGGYSVEIYSMMGQSVMKSQHQEQTCQIDISMLNRGVYSIVISNDHRVTVVKRLLVVL